MTTGCPECQRPVEAGDAFCRGCGTRLNAVDTAETGSDRRQLTVMFCDLVGSTEIASKLDPEDVQAVMRAYQHTAAEIVRNVEGYVAQYLGDGMLIYFGYPVAHEDDPLRAVSAALEIAREVPALSAGLRASVSGFGDADLAVRIGIHTGPVVVGAVGSNLRRERLASGPTVNLAARLAAAAAPGGTVVSNATAQRVQGVFELADLGRLTLKGIADPVGAWQPLRMRGMQSRIATWTAGSGRPMVGREALIAELLAAWESVRAGQTVAIMLRGDPGIGKTRLVQALRQRLASQRHGWIACYGSPLQRSNAFRPVVEAVRASLGLDDDEPPELQRALLGSALALVDFDRQEVIDRLGRLLDIASATTADPSVDERARTIEAMAEWWLRLARRQPMVMAVEDVHWLDPSTVELLGTILAHASDEPVLMLGTIRPDTPMPWTDPRVRIIEVGVLDPADTEVIVRDVLGSINPTAEQVRALIERSDGVPLYVEELARALVEQAADPGGGETIPGSLQDSLTARLDRLGGNKWLAQVGALLGRSFSYELIAAVTGLGEKALWNGLDELVTRQLLHRDGVLPRAIFTFQHALLQDAAAGSMLRQRRREEHRRIADILLTHFPDEAEDQPTLVAHHFAEAGETRQAIDWFARSGARATARAEFREAIAEYTAALSHLEQLPPGPDRDAQEIDLQLDLGVPYSMSASFGDPAVGTIFARAHALSLAAPSRSPRHFEALFGVASYTRVAGELDNSVAACNELLAYSKVTGNPAHAMAAQVTLGQVLYWQGHFVRSEANCLDALALCQRMDANPRAAAAVHPRISAGIFGSWAQWAVGKPAAARALADETLDFARDSGDPYWHALAAGFGSLNAIMLADPERTRRLAAEALQIAERHSITLIRGQAIVTEGWARTVIDGDAAGLAEVERGIAQLRAVGSSSGAPGSMSILADVHARLGNPHASLAVARAGLELTQRNGQNFYDSELHRLAGCAQAAIAGPDDLVAEASLRRAMAVARSQGAVSLELRSAVSLARMLAARGRASDARGAIEPVLARFPGSLHGVDCDDAHALLGELAA